MDPIIAFYSHNGTDHQGRTLKQIWNFSDDELEKSHDYIQWLFPTTEPSKFNSNAPLLTSETVCEFGEDEEMTSSLITSSFIFQRFLKLDNEIPFWVQKTGSRDNHNCLRISRVIASLNIIGLHERAESFYSAVLKAYIRNNPLPVYHWNYAHSTFGDFGSDILTEEISQHISSIL